MELNPHLAEGTPTATVLLTHGFAEHSGRYEEFVDALNAAGFDAWTFDLPGHGQSLGPRARVDVARLISEHLSARRDLAEVSRTDTVHLFGHSMGGLITLASTLLNPHGITSVAVTGPALMPNPHLPRPLMSASLAFSRFFPWFPTVRIDESLLTHDPLKAETYASDPLLYTGRVPLLTAATMVRQGEMTLRNAPLLQVPTLILHGDEDVLADPAGSAAFVERAGGKAELRIIEGAYHELLQEVERASIAEELIAWYRQW